MSDVDDLLERALTEVCRRSAVDSDFRALALRDARAAIAQVDSKVLTHGITIRFVDNSGPVRVIPLPDPLLSIEELSDAELGLVVGGGDIVSGALNRKS